MNNVIPLPLPEPAAPPANVSVMDTVFVTRLNAANALARKLRGWRIGVESIVIPASHENAQPMLWIRPDPAISIKPLLEATAQRRRWLPPLGRMPDRMVAELDGCFLMWVLRDRRAHPRMRLVGKA
ncbi:MAG: hypothetical protein FWG52_03995 [Proteobacteria bacterium]|nr:hypothetical protein [Pseudomonadota bacterium]